MQLQAQMLAMEPTYSYSYTYETYSYTYSDYEALPRRGRRRMRVVAAPSYDRRRRRDMAVVLRGDLSERSFASTSRRSAKAVPDDLDARLAALQAKFGAIEKKIAETDAEYREQADYFDHRLKEADSRAEKVEKLAHGSSAKSSKAKAKGKAKKGKAKKSKTKKGKTKKSKK